VDGAGDSRPGEDMDTSNGARRKLPSKSTDIYALGMTILEVRTNSPLLLLLSRNLTFPCRW
jgi:hypothetical protein